MVCLGCVGVGRENERRERRRTRRRDAVWATSCKRTVGSCLTEGVGRRRERGAISFCLAPR